MSKFNVDNLLQLISQASRIDVAASNISIKEALAPVTSHFAEHCHDMSLRSSDTYTNVDDTSLSGVSFVELSVGFNSYL